MDKSNATEAVAIPAPLEYAPQSAVGDLTLSRVGGVTTVTIKAGWRRILRVGWLFILTLGFWTLFYPALRFFASSLTGVPTVAWNGPAVAIGVGLALGSSAFFKVLIFTLHGFRWTVTVDGLQFTGRRFNEIVKVNQPTPQSRVAPRRNLESPATVLQCRCIHRFRASTAGRSFSDRLYFPQARSNCCIETFRGSSRPPRSACGEPSHPWDSR